MTIDEATQALLALSVSPRIESSLYPLRVVRLLEERGFDPYSLRTIHVAGSKGKGSLARTAFRLLSLEGFSVGLFTSPHLFNISERIETSQGLIPSACFCSLVEEFLPLFQQEEVHFFEAILYCALVFFLRQGCTHVVLEVGVGGRFDPTNFCQPELILMGHVSMEHRNFLGGDLQQIAFNKSGVLKSEVYALSQEQDPIVENIFRKEKADLHFFRELVTISSWEKTSEGSCCQLTLSLANGSYTFTDLFIKGIGQAAVQNFSLALAGILSLYPNLSRESIDYVAGDINPFRLQKISDRFLVDTAHNGQSFLNLCQALQQWLKWEKIHLYVSLMEGKEFQDVAEVLQQYAFLWKTISVFEFPVRGVRGSNGKALMPYLKGLPVVYVEDLSLDYVFSDDPIVWAGSFYSIEYLFQIIEKAKKKQ